MKAKHDWGAIERAVRAEGLKPSEIGRRFSVPLSTFYYRARQLNWPLPRDAGVPGSADATSGRGLSRRLKRVALKRLIELERRPCEVSPDSAVRSVESVLKLIERLHKLEADAQGQPRRIEWTQEYRDAKRAELTRRVYEMLAEARGVSVEEVMNAPRIREGGERVADGAERE